MNANVFITYLYLYIFNVFNQISLNSQQFAIKSQRKKTFILKLDLCFHNFDFNDFTLYVSIRICAVDCCRKLEPLQPYDRKCFLVKSSNTCNLSTINREKNFLSVSGRTLIFGPSHKLQTLYMPHININLLLREVTFL